MSRYLHQSHKVSVWLYHIVCPATDRRAVFTAEGDRQLKAVCAEIEKKHEIYFLDRGTDEDHVHFVVQSGPQYRPQKIIQTIRSIRAREIFKACPAVNRYLWGGGLWTDGDFISRVGAHGTEQMIKH